MDLLDVAKKMHFGDIHLHTDVETGLFAIAAVHDLTLGPAIGGCRFVEYPDTNAAIYDAMRLARGMTYKAAISKLPHGGGKSVIIRPADFDESKRDKFFEAFGAFIDSLGGQYITAKDSGTTVADMDSIHQKTDYVLGSTPEEGGTGDPSPLTAFGVRRGIEAAAKFKWDRDDLEGLKVAIQGVGSVGYGLARELHELGCTLVVADINEEAVQRCVDEFGALIAPPDTIHRIECDIYAPAALGGAINDETLPELQCDIVAGPANNQLSEDRHGVALRERQIVYVPDYALNAGGLINVAQEHRGYDAQTVRRKTEAIFDTILEILERADADGLPTNLVADRIVEEKIYGHALR